MQFHLEYIDYLISCTNQERKREETAKLKEDLGKGGITRNLRKLKMADGKKKRLR